MRAGFQVQVAVDGLIASRRLFKSKPDLVLLELLLPKMTGTDAIKNIRSTPGLNSTPIIVLSNASIADLGMKAIALGVERAFLKSHCTPASLILSIHKLLGAALPDVSGTRTRDNGTAQKGCWTVPVPLRRRVPVTLRACSGNRDGTCGANNFRYSANALQFSKTMVEKWLKPLTGGLLVALVLLLNAMAASPALHELIHADAGKADHECVVTLMAHGQVDSAVAAAAVLVPVGPIDFLPQNFTSVPNALVESLPPGRGPPVSLLPS